MSEFTIGWSDFAKKHSSLHSGNSYTVLKEWDVIRLLQEHWKNAIPGQGETDLSRKVLVPIPDAVAKQFFFLPPRANLVLGMPVYAKIVQRQDHEDPYVETYTTAEIARAFNALILHPAAHADIVCYSADALAENGEKRSTDCDWEIVAVLCRDKEGREPMQPLAMARNFLKKPGGTKSEYTAQEFAESIWHRSTQQGIKVKSK